MFVLRNIRSGFAVLLVAALMLFGISNPAIAATATLSDNDYVEGTDSQAFLFNPLVVNRADLTMTPENVEALRADPRTYHAATFKLTTAKGETKSYAVGLRIKGRWGSARDLDSKAAFKVKMNFSVPGQTLYGIKKFTFNNMVQDPSMLHEALSYRLFRAMGVAAPRVGYANIFLNGTRYGLYANIETYDKVMFKRWSPVETDHLYEGSYGTEIGADLEVDEGSETDKSDVIELKNLNDSLSGQAWFNTIRTKVNLNQMIMNWAVEHYIGHWDGYTRGWPNNYYVYKPVNGLFTMHPWGADQTWISRVELIDDGATMMTRCIRYTPCNDLYRTALAKISQKEVTMNFSEMVDRIWAKILPSNQSDPKKEYSTDGSINHINETKVFINDRRQQLLGLLGSRSLATQKVVYPTSGFKVDGVIKPKITATSNGAMTFARISGQGVCEVDQPTGFVTIKGSGVCRIAAQSSQTQNFFAEVIVQTITVPKLASTIIVEPFEKLARNKSFSLRVASSSSGKISARLIPGNCSLSAGRVTARASSGYCRIVVSVAGDASYLKASKEIRVYLKK